MDENDAAVPPKAADANENGRKKAPPKPSADEFDHFWLGRLYPEAHSVFQSTAGVDPTSNNVVVALDTNALLLPYQMGKGDLADLGTVYSRIAGEGRLFLPEQVAREFIKNRDRKLADMVHALEERISKLAGWDAQVSSLLLADFDNHEELTTKAAAHREAAKAYLDQLRTLLKHMRGWRGNDPVTALYAGIFGSEQIVGPGVSNDKVIEDLEYGLRHKVPPGYKDGSKDDQGVGDVLIWMSLLHLGKTMQKDLIFVTGEEKADWFVRSGGKRLYPRPELVDRYRRASNGCSIRLSSLHDLLKEMSAPERLVADVEDAEATANSAIQAASVSGISAFGSTAHTTLRTSTVRFYGGGPAVMAGQKNFDYSTYDGRLRVEDAGHDFDLAFSKCGGTSIYLLKRGTTQRIARVKNSEIGQMISIDAVDTTSSNYTVHVGEGFLVENEVGAVLAGRISEVQDDTRGADHDEVRFSYTINEPGVPIVMP